MFLSFSFSGYSSWTEKGKEVVIHGKGCAWKYKGLLLNTLLVCIAFD
jgi:hypothetical protein